MKAFEPERELSPHSQDLRGMGRGTKVGNCMEVLWKPGASNLHSSAQLEGDFDRKKKR